MKAADIRSRFLEYFEERGPHDRALVLARAGATTRRCCSSTPAWSSSRTCSSARTSAPYNRATTAQRCVRAGGKHNDLENVGYTARHHTFFEMLGNFSFGDYFKRDAIRFAWELLTKVYGLPPEKLWTTVYIDDDEAYDLWTKDIGVPAERCIRIGDNPGAQVRERQLLADGRHRPLRPVLGDLLRPRPRSLRAARPGRRTRTATATSRSGTSCSCSSTATSKGVMHPLPKPSVDTGMGLERLAAVLQHVHSNYEIDLFQDLIRAAARETGAKDLPAPSRCA